jgi:hypothetical protein
LEVELSGDQPENCVLAAQSLPLAPGNYQLQYSYRTSGIPAGAGLHWQLIDPRTNFVLAESEGLSSNSLIPAVLRFSISSGVSLPRLELNYQRTLGTPRISGSLQVRSTRVEALHEQ